MANKKSVTMSFEEAFQKLEIIAQTLEKGESTLEESMKAFEEGMALAKYCTQKLTNAERKLQKLIKIN